MKALLCSQFDDLDALHVDDISPPLIEPDQVLVAVEAVTLSFMDLLVLAGRYQVKPSLPFVPGGEAAGRVKRVGTNVQRFVPGDRVVCANWHGAMAQEMVAHEKQVVLIPDQVDFATASGVRQPYGTAHYALFRRALVSPGDVVIVSGAAGAVGSAAVDLALRSGHKVIACVADSEKAAYLAARGVEHVVRHREDNVRAAIKKLTAGRGPDVFLDMVGGDLFEMVTRNMNWNGRVVSVGYASGTLPSVHPGVLLSKNLSMHGAWFGPWAQQCPDVAAKDSTHIFERVAGGQLRPDIARVFPFTQWREALTAVSDRRSTGRVVVEVSA